VLFASPAKLQVIPCAMQGNLPDTLELVRAINDFPATGLLVLPPYYFKPLELEGLRRFFTPVIEASKHPVLLYHIPKYAVPVPAELVAGLAVWGVKDSAGETGYAQTILQAGKGVLVGTEDDYLGKLSSGAQGVISALANIIPERVLELYAAFKTADLPRAQVLSEQLKQVRLRTKEYAAPALLKKLAQARHGAAMGSVRPPLLPAPDDYDPKPVLELAGIEI
jgi:4-hydroxy-tetrahydrodipicolinate synthase